MLVVFVNPKVLIRMRLWKGGISIHNTYSPISMGLLIWELENYDSKEYGVKHTKKSKTVG